MSRVLLLVIAALWLLTGGVILVAPRTFYELTPGVALMGPFSIHFILDVGLAFIASGVATFWGALTVTRTVVIAGVGWPLLHALFHIQIWMHRGFPLDQVFAFDLVAVIAPAAIALALAWRLRTT